MGISTAFTATALGSGGSGSGLLATFLTSGPVALIVAGILLLLSIASWSIMIRKYVLLKRAALHGRKFLHVFRTSSRFSEVNNWSDQLHASPLVAIFQAGYVEIDRQVRPTADDAPGSALVLRSFDNLQRTLRRSLSEELLRLAKGSGFLATTAAASPFIGLFGTVWGIMNAFSDIAMSGSTSLVAVAPGIAEALVNTALGLGAAIPALIGFNYFSNKLRRLRAQMEDFILEFLSVADRNFTGV